MSAQQPARWEDAKEVSVGDISDPEFLGFTGEPDPRYVVVIDSEYAQRLIAVCSFEEDAETIATALSATFGLLRHSEGYPR